MERQYGIRSRDDALALVKARKDKDLQEEALFGACVKASENKLKDGLSSIPNLVRYLHSYSPYMIWKFVEQMRRSKGKEFIDQFRLFMEYSYKLPSELIDRERTRETLVKLNRDQLLAIARLRAHEDRERALEAEISPL